MTAVAPLIAAICIKGPDALANLHSGSGGGILTTSTFLGFNPM